MVFILVDQQVTEVDKAQANFKLAIVNQQLLYTLYSQDRRMMKRRMIRYGTLINFQNTLYMFSATSTRCVVKKLR